MPRLILFNPVSDHERGLHRKKATRFPPLGLAYLAAVTPPDWDIKLIDENIQVAPFPDADLVGITSFTSTVNRAYEIATFYRRKDIPVVMGGIHVTMLPDEALNYADCVVQGEGEWVWPQVLKDFERGHLKRTYKPVREKLSHLPLPRRDLFSPDYSWGTIQTSRGCPMECHFCSVTAFNGRLYRQRPLEEVWDELKAIPHKNIFFVDDNILGYGRAAEKRAIRLFRGIVEQGIRKRFLCQTSINFAENPEVLFWAKKAGCKMIFIGLESVSENSLRYFGKSYNLKTGVHEYAKSIRQCHHYGIGVIGALMFGSDGEDTGIFRRTLRFIRESGLDVVQVTFATPLPGTRFFEDLYREERLTLTDFPADWNEYRFSHVIFKPKGISEEDFYYGMALVKDGLYTRLSFAKRVFRTLLETRDFSTAYLSLKLNSAFRRGYEESAYFQTYSSMRSRGAFSKKSFPS